MKRISLVVMVMIAGILMMQSCKNDSDVKKSAREKLHQTDQKIAKTSKQAKDVIKKVAEEPVGPLTTVEFKNKVYDFGTVMEGEYVEHDFEFKNTGNEPLILKKVKPSCGCTVPTWPRDPIPPGKTGIIHAKFNTARRGRPGGAPQNKHITVTGNIEGGKVVLTLKGKVDKKDDGKVKVKKNIKSAVKTKKRGIKAVTK